MAEKERPEGDAVPGASGGAALPGDPSPQTLAVHLTINGQPISKDALPDYYDEDNLRYAQQFGEQLGEVQHRILNDRDRPGFVIPMPESQKFRDNCSYSAEGVTCTVPAGHYFVMGDNHDNSQDSRYWGFVPDENIVGKAFFVWMNFGNLGRIGSFK